MAAVAQRRRRGALAGAEPDLAGRLRLEFAWRERRSFVRTVAQRLRLGTAAGAPPVALAYFHVHDHRLASADLRYLAHFKPLPLRSSATPRRRPSPARARAKYNSAARSPRSRRARRAG